VNDQAPQGTQLDFNELLDALHQQYTHQIGQLIQANAQLTVVNRNLRAENDELKSQVEAMAGADD
jgi:hypothetical protein